MRIISYIGINIFLFIICALTFHIRLQEGKTIIFLLFATLTSILLINLILFILEKILSKLIDYILRIYEKRKMKNYNLLEWMGEEKWIKLYDNLTDIKGFDKISIHENFNIIKSEIKKEFDNNEKLKSLKVYLEIVVESPKLMILNSITQTLMMALITTSLINYIKGIESMDNSGIWYIIVVVIVWFALLSTISFITKQIDRYRLLLKLVSECIIEEQESGKKDRGNRVKRNGRRR